MRRRRRVQRHPKKTVIELPKVKLRIKVKTVEFDNCEVSVDSKFVQEMLRLPSGGSLLSNMDYISENNEESYMFEWKKQYENIDKLRLKQLKNELVQTSVADDNFRINFLVLYINIFCESTSMEKIRFLEDILQESGGFGCGHANEAYVEEEFQESEYNEEESGGDEVDSDDEEDLCDEDEEDFDVNKISDVEVYESKISYMYQKMEDLKRDLVVKIDEGVLKFPQRGRSGPHEGNIGKNHVEGKGDYDEDDEQGSGSGCNKEEDMNLNFVVENVTKSVGLIDSQEGTVNLGEDDHKNKVISDRTVDKIIVAKKDGEGEDVEDCSNKNKDGENVEDCSNKNKDSNETRSLKNDRVLSFSLGFSQDSEGSKKSSQSQISFERMTKKNIKDRVILGNPSVGPECVIPNVDVIDASPISFAPPLGTLEGPSKLVSGKHNDINEEATSVVDVKGKRQMKFSYVYKSPFKERLIDFKPSLTQVENVVCEWLFSLQGNPG
ncbi:unnamed protein product [Lactuca saligna]|uniref:Uncharacterized protein n=1 Tax=Lactuca saligna TaxID=75948 RepID=A0AA35YAG4_LACSI|nr:unnamed protein product [Lactuca saligna]